MAKAIECPHCGILDRTGKDVWKNSSGQIECDNCGYSEADEDEYEED